MGRGPRGGVSISFPPLRGEMRGGDKRAKFVTFFAVAKFGDGYWESPDTPYSPPLRTDGED